MKKIALFIVMVAVAATSYAQPQCKKQDGNRAKRTTEQTIDAKVQRMQDQLMLDDASAKKFASIYKEYLQEQQKLRKDCGRCDAMDGKKLTEPKRLSDAELVARQKDRMAQAKKSAELKESYYNKLSKVLSARQLEKVFFAKPKASFGGKRGEVVGLHRMGGRDNVSFGPRDGRKQCTGDNCKASCDKQPAEQK